MEVNLQNLLEKYLKGTCTAEEMKLLESWHLEELRQNAQHIEPEELLEAEKRLSAKMRFRPAKSSIAKTVIANRIGAGIGIPKTYSSKRILKVAAILILLTSLAYFFFKPTPPQPTRPLLITTNKIVPGKSKAILYLADGSRIALDDSAKGKLARQGDAVVSKENSNGISYQQNGFQAQKTNGIQDSKVLLNTLVVPLGATYKLVLADGSKVWLNSGSSLKFPVSFSSPRRKVELLGEAYFEVAKNAKLPFVVKTAIQDVLVTGTHFNVMAYPEDRLTTTTLFEGQVHIVNGQDRKVLKPGQQSQIRTGESNISIEKAADLEAALAWKNGYFMSAHENLKSIMNKIARWYNVEVEYQGDFSNKYFSGTISKQEDFKEVLNIIQLTNSVQFKIVGRRITVMH
jgi:transmembrane sensor